MGQNVSLAIDGMTATGRPAAAILEAAQAIDKNSDPTEDEIREALAGNLCRCGAYPQHPRAVAGAAQILREKAQ